VRVGGVHGAKVSGEDVVAALPLSRFDRCYRKGLSDRGAAISGGGSLHLDIDGSGHIGSAAFAAGNADLVATGQCIADAAVGANIKHVQDGVTGADVDLSFHAE